MLSEYQKPSSGNHSETNDPSQPLFKRTHPFPPSYVIVRHIHAPCQPGQTQPALLYSQNIANSISTVLSLNIAITPFCHRGANVRRIRCHMSRRCSSSASVPVGFTARARQYARISATNDASSCCDFIFSHHKSAYNFAVNHYLPFVGVRTKTGSLVVSGNIHTFTS